MSSASKRCAVSLNIAAVEYCGSAADNFSCQAATLLDLVIDAAISALHVHARMSLKWELCLVLRALLAHLVLIMVTSLWLKLS